MTNIAEFYKVPQIIPTVLPDDPEKAKSSDHNTILATPLSSFFTDTPVNTYVTKLIRPQPESKIKDFGQWIVKHDWPSLEKDASPTELVSQFEEVMKTNLDKFLPEKIVKICTRDKPYINSELKVLDRKVKRVYMLYIFELKELSNISLRRYL